MSIAILIKFLLLGGAAFLTFKLLRADYRLFQQKMQKKPILIDWTFVGVYSLLLTALYFVEPLLLTESNAFHRGVEIGLLFSAMQGVALILIYLFALFLGRKYDSLQVDLDRDGFSMRGLVGLRKYVWRDFTHAQIDDEISTLILNGNKKIEITADSHQFYLLLRSLPQGYAGLDYSKITEFFANLKPCKICGSIAVQDDACLECATPVYDPEFDVDFSSEAEFIKDNQLSWFCLTDEEVPFHDFKHEYDGFDLDPHWKPIVSKQDVLDYSKKYFWDSE